MNELYLTKCYKMLKCLKCYFWMSYLLVNLVSHIYVVPLSHITTIYVHSCGTDSYELSHMQRVWHSVFWMFLICIRTYLCFTLLYSFLVLFLIFFLHSNLHVAHSPISGKEYYVYWWINIVSNQKKTKSCSLLALRNHTETYYFIFNVYLPTRAKLLLLLMTRQSTICGKFWGFNSILWNTVSSPIPHNVHVRNGLFSSLSRTQIHALKRYFHWNDKTK